MSSSSSPSKSSSAPPLVQVLLEIRAAAERLGDLLRPALPANPPAKRVLDKLQRSVSRALSLVDLRERWPSAAKRKPAPAGRRLCRRRSSQPYSRRSISKTLEDGHTWRKYGQKDIQSANYPRSYFRCTHKNDQGCKAIRHVQLSEEDPSSYVITYLGEHTCRDPAAGQLPPSMAGSRRLISFAGGMVAEEEDEAAAAVPSLGQEYFPAAVPDGEGELMVDLMELESLLGFDGGAGCCFWEDLPAVQMLPTIIQ